MRISMIVAAARNDVIGSGNDLPWHLPDDLRYFKRMTRGKPVIMGRRTYQSVGSPLPQRVNIVVTRHRDFQAGGAVVVSTVDAALDRARSEAARAGGDEIMVVGGAEIYRAALPRADRIYLTRIDAEPEGDTFFPTLDPAQWQVVASEAHEADADHAYAFRFLVLERCG